jgi:hypothetical protein
MVIIIKEKEYIIQIKKKSKKQAEIFLRGLREIGVIEVREVISEPIPIRSQEFEFYDIIRILEESEEILKILEGLEGIGLIKIFSSPRPERNCPYCESSATYRSSLGNGFDYQCHLCGESFNHNDIKVLEVILAIIEGQEFIWESYYEEKSIRDLEIAPFSDVFLSFLMRFFPDYSLRGEAIRLLREYSEKYPYNEKSEYQKELDGVNIFLNLMKSVLELQSEIKDILRVCSFEDYIRLKSLYLDKDRSESIYGFIRKRIPQRDKRRLVLKEYRKFIEGREGKVVGKLLLPEETYEEYRYMPSLEFLSHISMYYPSILDLEERLRDYVDEEGHIYYQFPSIKNVATYVSSYPFVKSFFPEGLIKERLIRDFSDGVEKDEKKMLSIEGVTERTRMFRATEKMLRYILSIIKNQEMLKYYKSNESNVDLEEVKYIDAYEVISGMILGEEKLKNLTLFLEERVKPKVFNNRELKEEIIKRLEEERKRLLKGREETKRELKDGTYLITRGSPLKIFDGNQKEFTTIDDLVDWIDEGMGDAGFYILSKEMGRYMIQNIVSHNGEAYELPKTYSSDDFFALWKKTQEKIDDKIDASIQKCQKELGVKLNDSTYESLKSELYNNLESLENLDHEIKENIENLNRNLGKY